MVENVDISIVGVTEKDIDLLLLEEFVSSPEFVNWFTGRLNLSSVDLLAASRGVSDATGESDLTLKLTTDSGSTAIINIENKVSASFQPLQKERYRQRGEEQVRQGVADDYYLCLVAPSCYLGAEGQEEFDAFLCYGDILDWLKESRIEGERRAYKCALLTKAIERAKYGWQLKEDAAVTALWKRYWQRSQEIASVLQMQEPTGKPATSSFVFFRAPKLFAGIRLVHKMRHGNADIQIAGWGTRVHELTDALAGKLDDGMKITNANKSAVIRLQVPVLNLQGSYDEQAQSVDDGLKGCLRLYR